MTPRPPSQPGPSGADEAVVFVVDDDDSLRRSLSSLFRSVGLRVELFGSARELLQGTFPDVPSCIVLDIRLPGISGLDFQSELARADIHIPIIFMTGYGDIPMTAAIEQDRKRRSSDKTTADLRGLFDRLSPREREVMGLVTAGLMNKQVAAETGLAEITVKIHRGNVMRKMGARSFADLVRMAELLDVRRGKS